MSFLGKLLAAPVRVVAAAAAVTNVIAEAATGDNLDVFDIEDKAKELAEEIEDRA